jgi:soluble lytic murein transglycosylase-like protein
MGPKAAMERLAELQARIDSLTPRPPAATGGPGSFASILSGAIGGNSPIDPSQLEIAGSSRYGDLAVAAANKYGVDQDIFKRLVEAESNWNPNSVSPKGAIGLTQLMPGTASGLGVTDPYNPIQNLDGGARYLRQMLDTFGGDYTKALAAYNAGPAAVKQANGIPPIQETIAYVRKIMGGSGL